MSDASELVVEIQHVYGVRPDDPLEVTELATAAGFLPLLEALDIYTTELEEQAEARRLAGQAMPEAVKAAAAKVELRIAAWRVRLEWYLAMAKTPDNFDDPQEVLWTITAPLLLGHFYGEDGKESVRPPGDWEHLPPLANAPPDLRTPFLLMTEVDAHGSVRRPSLADAFAEATADTAGLVGKTVGNALVAVAKVAGKAAGAAADAVGFKWWHGAAVLGGVFVLWRFTR